MSEGRRVSETVEAPHQNATEACRWGPFFAVVQRRRLSQDNRLAGLSGPVDLLGFFEPGRSSQLICWKRRVVSGDPGLD